MRDDRLTYTVPEAAHALGLSQATVWRYIRAGRIKAFRWVGRTLIRADSLQGAIDRASGRLEDGPGRSAER